jgi:hypothetical protein
MANLGRRATADEVLIRLQHYDTPANRHPRFDNATFRPMCVAVSQAAIVPFVHWPCDNLLLRKVLMRWGVQRVKHLVFRRLRNGISLRPGSHSVLHVTLSQEREHEGQAAKRSKDGVTMWRLAYPSFFV